MKVFIFLMLNTLSMNSFAFQSFQEEAKKSVLEIGCLKVKITPPSNSWGVLLSCIGGKSDTVKFFINETPGSGKVKNTKLLWNDWTKDTGKGIHTDKATAKAWATSIAAMYAPNKTEEVVNAFFSTKDQKIESESYVMKYSFNIGPAINEHLLEINTRQQVSFKTDKIKTERNDFQTCKLAISTTVNYAEIFLTGDGDPIQEPNYKSFSIGGKNRDMFFCEIHPNNKYKIKAALRGKFPFKYIFQGDF